MSSKREFTNSPVFQGEDEELAYEVDTSEWEGYTSDATNVLKDKDGTDVSDTKLDGAPSAVGDVITTSVVKDLEAGMKYRLEVMWIHLGNVFEGWGYIIGEV